MNRQEAIKWGEWNLSPQALRNFKKAIYSADSFMTAETYESNRKIDEVWRKIVTSEPITTLEEKHQKEKSELQAQIQELQEQMRELYETHKKEREELFSNLYKAEEQTPEYKEIEEYRKEAWAVVGAIRQIKIDEIVEKYKKKVKVSA